MIKYEVFGNRGSVMRAVFVFALALLLAPSRQAVATEVNIEGKAETWYGTARHEDIGHVVDHVTIPDKSPRPGLPSRDLHETFSKHGGTRTGETLAFHFATPKAGRYVFAYGSMTGKNKSIVVRYRSGDQWAELPPGRIEPDFFRGWDLRTFCYWAEIPEGQDKTVFEFTNATASGLRGALIAEPFKDPFGGMPGVKRPVLVVPTLERLKSWQTTELGRAVIASAGGVPRPMTDEDYAAAKQSLPGYEIDPAKMGRFWPRQRRTWAMAMDAVKFRITGDKRYAQLAGAKGRRVCKWPASIWRSTGEGSYTLAAMAITYDLAGDGMEAADREAIRAIVERAGHWLYVESLLRPGPTYGHRAQSSMMLGAVHLAGLIMEGESRYAREWRGHYKAAAPRVIAYYLDADGVYRTPFQYCINGLNLILLADVTATRAGGESGFSAHGGRMGKLTDTLVYMSAPNNHVRVGWGKEGPLFQSEPYDHEWERLSRATLLMGLTNGPKANLARWLARHEIDRWIDEDGVENRSLPSGVLGGALNVLLYNPGGETSPSESGGFDLGWHVRSDVPGYNNGYLVMQTGFDSPDAIKMVMKCGNPRSAIGQPVQGSFVLYAYGNLLSQAPNSNAWSTDPRGHNLILVDGKGQPRYTSDDGHIERFVHSPVSDLVIANLKPAYDGHDRTLTDPVDPIRNNPVNKALRYFLFVRKPDRKGYFVIVDDMDKDGKEHEYTWLYHANLTHTIEPDGQAAFVARRMTKPEAIELWEERSQSRMVKNLQSERRNRPGYMWPHPTKSRPWQQEKKVDLRLEMVWPREFSYEVKFTGMDGRTYMKERRAMTVPDYLEITQTAADAVFFTVLYPERADLGIKMPGIEKIAASDLWGFTMGEDTVLFSRREGTWKHGDIETDARLVYVRRDEGGKVTAFAAGEATTLKVAGKKLFESKKKVTAAGGEPKIVTDDGGAWRATSAKRGMPD